MKLRLGCLHPLILRFPSLFRVAHSGTGVEKEGSLSLFFFFFHLLSLRLQLQVHLGWLAEGDSLLFPGRRCILSAVELMPHHIKLLRSCEEGAGSHRSTQSAGGCWSLGKLTRHRLESRVLTHSASLPLAPCRQQQRAK